MEVKFGTREHVTNGRNEMFFARFPFELGRVKLELRQTWVKSWLVWGVGWCLCIWTYSFRKFDRGGTFFHALL